MSENPQQGATENVDTPQESNLETTTAYVTAESGLVGTRRRNLFITSGVIGFTGMLFQFTIIFFFTLKLKSVALVGIFLAIGNLFSLILDVPVGRLQKFFSAKTLFRAAGVAQLLSGLIFMNFLLKFLDFDPKEDANMIVFLFGNALNWVMLLVCSLLYGLAKELNDITTLSYILDNSSPDDVANITSTNNIVTGIGSVGGLLLAGILLTANTQFLAIGVLVVVILVMMVIQGKFFDNSETTIDLSQVSQFKVLLKKDAIAGLKDAAIAEVSKADLGKIISKTKYVFMKPMEVRHLPFKQMIGELKVDTIAVFETIQIILKKMPPYVTLFWAMGGVLMFGFWDTIAATFLVDFLDGLKGPPAHILLLCLAIPAFGLQWPFIALSKKFWSFALVVTGCALSWISLIMMSMVDGLAMSMICAVINSVGYAMGMALAQEAFLNIYNEVYAREKNLTEIESNASAAPMKMLQNLANVIGLAIGGIMIMLLDFWGLFFVLGIGFLAICGISLAKKSQISI